MISSYPVFQHTFDTFPAKKVLSFQQHSDSNFGNQSFQSFQRTFCVKLMEQACMSANERFWSEIKRSIKQLLSRGRIFNDHLRNFNTENSVWIQFILYGSNKITREIFSGECFTEVATFLKSYWKHCQYTKFCSVFSLPRICSA